MNPAVYRSASGRFVLKVEPGDRDGKGPAEYALLDQGQAVWAAERPFTLFDARVGEDGLVAGYAYDAGLYTDFDPGGNLRIIVLEPTGRVRFEHVLPRQPSRLLHEERGEPHVLGLVFDPAHDRFVVRTSEARAREEAWRTYRLSDGAAVSRVEPDRLMQPTTAQRWIADAQHVPDTPLTLVAWTVNDWDHDRSGVRFTLVTASAQPVWSLALPDDWPPEQRRTSPSVAFAWDKGPIVATTARGFTVLHARPSLAVSYAIEPLPDATGKWQVAETGRRAFVAPESKLLPLAGVPERTSRYLGSFGLRHRDVDSPMRGVTDFEIDDQGRFGFLRRDPDGTRFVLTDDDGSLIREVLLDAGTAAANSVPRLAWCGASRWLVVWSLNARDDSTAVWLDADNGAQTAVNGFAAGDVQALAGRRDGGFVLIERTDSPSERAGVVYTGTSLAAFDSGGAELWRVGDQLSVDEDVTVTPSGQIAAIGPIRNEVQVFSGSGLHEKTFELKQALGREAHYPSGIAADIEGGFLCDDFSSPTPLVRLRSDGTLRAALAPHYSDGRPTGRLYRVRIDPAGRLWGTDGEALLRLNDKGVVDRVVGPSPNARELGSIASVAVNADRVYAVDQRTGSVHVFGPDERVERVLPVEPGEAKDQLRLPDVTIASDERACVDIGDVGEPRHVCFSGDGRRIAPIEWPEVSGRRASRDNRTWWFQTGMSGYWVEDRTHFSLLDSDGTLQRLVEKRANGDWLRQFPHLVPATDGSVVAVHGGGLGGDPWSLDIYNIDGAPAAGFDLPAEAQRHSVAYDGRRIALWYENTVVLLNTDGTPTDRFRPVANGRALKDLPLFLAAGGRELWLFEADGPAIHRFPLPDSTPDSAADTAERSPRP